MRLRYAYLLAVDDSHVRHSTSSLCASVLRVNKPEVSEEERKRTNIKNEERQEKCFTGDHQRVGRTHKEMEKSGEGEIFRPFPALFEEETMTKSGSECS